VKSLSGFLIFAKNHPSHGSQQLLKTDLLKKMEKKLQIKIGAPLLLRFLRLKQKLENNQIKRPMHYQKKRSRHCLQL